MSSVSHLIVPRVLGQRGAPRGVRKVVAAAASPQHGWSPKLTHSIFPRRLAYICRASLPPCNAMPAKSGRNAKLSRWAGARVRSLFFRVLDKRYAPRCSSGRQDFDEEIARQSELHTDARPARAGFRRPGDGNPAGLL